MPLAAAKIPYRRAGQDVGPAAICRLKSRRRKDFGQRFDLITGLVRLPRRSDGRRKNALLIGWALALDLPAATQAAVHLNQTEADLPPRLGPLVLLRDQSLLNGRVAVEVDATQTSLI